MWRNTCRFWVLCGAVTVVIVSVGGYLAAQEDVLIPAPGPIELTIQALDDEARPRFDVLLALTDDEKPEEAAADKFWLGLQIAAVPELAKQQLGVDYGLAVEDVTADSPAAKAEIKPHDILVKAGDVPLKEAGDLVKVVEGSEGKDIKITIVRGGKDRTITVTPARRPEKERTVIARVPRPELDADIKRLEEALESLKNKAGKDGFGLWFPKPAIVAPRLEVRQKDLLYPKPFKDEFPEDLSVQINKQGDQPAKIHVKRGDKEWDVTEDKLSDLPDDVRPHVQKLLGRMIAPGLSSAAQRILRVTPEGKVEGELRIAPNPPSAPAAPRSVRPPAAPRPPMPPQGPRALRFERSDGGDDKLDAILKKLDERTSALDKLDQKVEQLRKEVEDLRGKSDRK